MDVQEIDPVIEAYKKDVDQSLLDEALRLTPEQRLLKLIELHRFAHELRKAKLETEQREKQP